MFREPPLPDSVTERHTAVTTADKVKHRAFVERLGLESGRVIEYVPGEALVHLAVRDPPEVRGD